MMEKREAALPPGSRPLNAGPILSDRPCEITTIWRDGEVWRETHTGRAQERPRVPPILDNPPEAA